MSNGYIVKLRGLPWSSTTDEIVNFFRFSKILNGNNGVHMIASKEGRPSGEAFVELINEQDLKMALMRNRCHLGNRYIEVTQSSKNEMDYVIQCNGIIHGNDSVRLRGLPFDCSNDEIIEFFANLVIVPNGITFLTDSLGRNNGQAYVQFTNKEMAEKALKKHRAFMRHRYIEVFRSSSFEMTNVANTDYRIDLRPIVGRRLGLHCVHMRGLPYQTTTRDIECFFKPITPKAIYLLYDEFGRPSGEADVEFKCHDDALKSMIKDNQYINHRYIELFLNSIAKR